MVHPRPSRNRTSRLISVDREHVPAWVTALRSFARVDHEPTALECSGKRFTKAKLLTAAREGDTNGHNRQPGGPQRSEGNVVHIRPYQDDRVRRKFAVSLDKRVNKVIELLPQTDWVEREVNEEEPRSESSPSVLCLAERSPAAPNATPATSRNRESRDLTSSK